MKPPSSPVEAATKSDLLTWVWAFVFFATLLFATTVMYKLTIREIKSRCVQSATK